MTKDSVPPLLKSRTKDPLDSSWRMHMKEGQWVPDVAVNGCMICKVDFTFWNRKHHCRRCGAVVCFACSGSRTKFIYKEITPEKVAPEEMRVCDSCIQVIDEKLAEGMHRRLHNNNNNNSEENQEQSNASSSGNNTDEQEASFLSHEQRQKQNQEDKAGGRAVLTHGRYRAEIKESEGNRYIRDNDL